MMALAMVLTLSQCKKQEQTNSIEADGETVSIVLDVRDHGTRCDVNTETGVVSFQQNDVVLVGSGGKYVGTLTCRGDRFMGDIVSPTENEPLKFFFLGNRATTETLTAGTSTSCTVNISNQKDITKRPVISFALSTENYSPATSTYHAFFENRAALVKFNVYGASSTEGTIITGLNNQVTVNFNATDSSEDPIYSYSEAGGDGNIILPAGNGEKWAILLPQDALSASSSDNTLHSEDGMFHGCRPAIPAINANGYLFQGIDINLHPKGATAGKFTVNTSGDQVYFSNGNLQYICSATTPYWRFANHQYDYLGTTTGQNSAATNVDRDLFGWGASGDPYMPYLTSTSSSDYPTNETDFTDWGNNTIQGVGTGWRTLTGDEWNYVINERTGIRYEKVSIHVDANNDIPGIILFPDNWNTSIYSPTNPNTYTADAGGVITLGIWNDCEASGAIFLPAAGHRSGIVYYDYSEASSDYWSSTISSENNKMSIRLSFQNSLIITHTWANNGFSVRLVKDVE